jgi:CBS domain containing-hemolysin-like protein
MRGEVVSAGDLRIEVLESTDRQVQRVRVSLAPQAVLGL